MRCDECGFFTRFITEKGYKGVECSNRDCPTLEPIGGEPACSFAKRREEIEHKDIRRISNEGTENGS